MAGGQSRLDAQCFAIPYHSSRVAEQGNSSRNRRKSPSGCFCLVGLADHRSPEISRLPVGW